MADQFAVKPLVRMVQTGERFQVLGLDRHRARLFEGDRDELHELDLRGVPATVEDALGGAARPGEPLPPSPSSHAPLGSPSHHARKGDDVKLDTERFFRVIDEAVWEQHSRPSGLPLVLAALPENQSIFRSVTKNLNLLPGGVEGNPEAMSKDQLRQTAWEVAHAPHAERVARMCEDFRTALAHGKATDDLRRAAEAAHAGRVAWAMLEADRFVPGVYYSATGQIRAADPDERADDDLLDAVGEAVLRSGGRVLTLPGAMMPTATGVAALYRY